jgi:GMP synthase (glutamine-hydrolysing)
MARPPRLLVLDAYAPEGRAALRRVGGTEAGLLYRRVLTGLAPDAAVDVCHPADSDTVLPSGRSLTDYDGVVWTGSSLSVLEQEDPRVRRQIELARAVYREGVPSFGSCWAAQLSVVAAGGRCAANPKGREFGVARRIRLADEGRVHPLYAGKAAVFDAFTSHADEVVELPGAARLLASNDWSRIQAVDIESASGVFWAVQYHPEYDLHEVASLCRLRRDELVAQGTYASTEGAQQAIDDMQALHRDPARTDLAEKLGVAAELLDPKERCIEVRNWLEHCVLRTP